jgi:tetratricopeptide (TPR) repeat protein
LNDFGQVVGVASQSIKGTEIDFAVPPQSIHDMLARTPAPKVPSYGRSCSKEVLQTLQRLDRSASCEKDSRAKVFKEQLLLAAAVADESPGKAIEVLRPLLDNMPTEWKFFAEYILGKAQGDLLPASSSGKLEDVADLARGKQAEELLEGSMKSNREFMSSQLEYCKLMIRLEDYQGGLEVAKFFAKSSPKCCEAHLILAEIHDLLGNAKEALQSYAFALLVDPVSKRNQDRFVKFLRDNDDSHDAKVLFLTEQSVSSGDKKGVWSFILGMVHQEYKDYDKAFKAFEDAIADGVPFGQKVFERMEAIRKATRAPE